MAFRTCIPYTLSAFLLGISFHAKSGETEPHDFFEVPDLGATPQLTHMKDFAEQSREAIERTSRCKNTSRAILAPLGGSRINPLSELDADTLVIIDALRPGSPDGVREAFSTDREHLVRSLQAAITGGSMSWWEAAEAYPVAQLLGRLYVQYGVEEVKLTYHVVKGTQETTSFDGKTGRSAYGVIGVVADNESALLVRLQFNLEGRRRQAVYMAAKMLDDSQGRPAWPVELLRHLVPRGFAGVSIAADFMELFSAYPHNGFELASSNLIDLLAPAGTIMLDYPRGAYYNTPQVYKGVPFVGMGGRADLEGWGFELAATLAVSEPVFGYSGTAAEDAVRIYRLPGRCPETIIGADIANISTAWNEVYAWHVDLGGYQTSHLR